MTVKDCPLCYHESRQGCPACGGAQGYKGLPPCPACPSGTVIGQPISDTIASPNVTDWTTDDINAGDVIGFNVDSATTVKRVTLQLFVTRT